MFRFVVFCFCVFAHVRGELTNDEKKEMEKVFMPVVLDCLDELGISKEDFEKIKASKGEGKEGDPCLLSCIFKGKGLINDKGMFDKDAANKIAAIVLQSKEKTDMVKDLGDTCESVNEKDVGDGTKGCDRAILLMQCFKEHKSEFGQV